MGRAQTVLTGLCRLRQVSLKLSFWFVSIAMVGSVQGSPGGFPLDPLTPEEITATVRILKTSGRLAQSYKFSIITLHEPPKDEVLGFRPGDRMRRESFAVVYDRENNRTYEAIVDLKEQRIIAWKQVPGSQPAFLTEDFFLAQSIVHANREWQQAMARRGIQDLNNIQIDAWSAGYYGFPEEEGVRVVRALSYYRGKSKNPYARPIEGVVAYVDLNQKRVLRLVDTGPVSVPAASRDLDAASAGKLRKAPNPLDVVQTLGPGFELTGNEIRWQNWDFRFALNSREGLVLYTVGYQDGDRLRSVLYRASLSEMVVPYGDPGPTWFFRNAFDEGEHGIGRLAQPLQPLVDAPGNAVLLDGVFASDTGSPSVIPRAVAIYERDSGILWKHVDYLSGRNESRRARDLVLEYVASVSNYEYAFNWIFHQDGSLEMEVDLTGIMQAKAVDYRTNAENDGHHAYGHRVDSGLEAVHHQHFFNFRLDLDVDGVANRVVEMNTEPVPAGPGNPYSNAFTTTVTPFRTELEAQRQVNMVTSRKWVVVNDNAPNRLGQAAGYMLVPGENSVPYAGPNSSVRRRAGFVDHHFWVTPYAPEEMNSAGFYVTQSKGGEGLPTWTAANRSIDARDVVIWYTMGITHIPRPEEWPVMTAHRAGFKLVPCGFFDRNPALDVPPVALDR